MIKCKKYLKANLRINYKKIVNKTLIYYPLSQRLIRYYDKMFN